MRALEKNGIVDFSQSDLRRRAASRWGLPQIFICRIISAFISCCIKFRSLCELVRTACSDGSGKGTCTCTCETKPVSSSSSSSSSSSLSGAESGIVHPLKPVEQYVPQTASLMRTASKPRQGGWTPPDKPKNPVKQQQSQTQRQGSGRGSSGIISVPPLNDYAGGGGLQDNTAYDEPGVSEQSDFMEPDIELQQQHQQQQQADDAQRQQYVISINCCV